MALARALAVEPKVLLLDEPFGALDARVRQDLRSWLRRLHDDVHVTTILVTHDQQEAMEISDQVIVMNHGHVQQAGNPRQVYDNPVNEFVMSFVGDANRVGDQMFRPHGLTISLEPGDGRVSGIIKRVVFLGFEVRAEVGIDQETIRIQLTRQEADRLALAPDQRVYVTLDGSRRFPLAEDEPATAVA
jgi:sulfate transport system ATP-binding protein